MFKRSVLIPSALLLLFAGCSALDAAKSPIDTGSFTVDGRIALSKYSGDATRYGSFESEFALTVAGSGFVHRGLALGWQFSYSRKTNWYVEVTSYGLGPRVAYYILDDLTSKNTAERFFPYVAFAYQYVQNDGIIYRVGGYVYLPPTPPAQNVHSLRYSCGLTYLATRDIGITGDLTYQQDLYDYGQYGDKTGHGFSFSLGLACFFW